MAAVYAPTEVWDPNAQPGGITPDSLKEAYASSGIGHVMEKFGSPGNAFRIDPVLAQHKPFDTITEMYTGKNVVLTTIVRGRYESANTWHFIACPRVKVDGLQAKRIVAYHIPSVMPNRRTPLTQPDRFSTVKSEREVIMTQFALGVDFEGDALRASGEESNRDFDMKMAVMASSAVLQGKYHVHVAFLTSKIEHRSAVAKLGQPHSNAYRRVYEEDNMLGILHREKGIYLLLSHANTVMSRMQKSYSMVIMPEGARELMAYGTPFETEYFRRGAPANEALQRGGDAFDVINGKTIYEEKSKIFAQSQGPIEHDPMLNNYSRGLYWVSTNDQGIRREDKDVTASRSIWFVDFDSGQGSYSEITLDEMISNAICFDQTLPHLPLREGMQRLAANPDSAISDIGNVKQNRDGDNLIDPFIYFSRTNDGARSATGKVCRYWGQQDLAYASEEFYTRIAMCAEKVVEKELTSYGGNGGAAILRLLDILNAAYEKPIDVDFVRSLGGDAVVNAFGVPPLPANSAAWQGSSLPAGMSTYAHAAYLATVYETGSYPADTSPQFRALLEEISAGVRATRKLLGAVRRIFGSTDNSPNGGDAFENLFLRASTQLPGWKVQGPLAVEYAFFMNCIDTVKVEARTVAASVDGNNARREDGVATPADLAAMSVLWRGWPGFDSRLARKVLENAGMYTSLAQRDNWSPANNQIVIDIINASDGVAGYLGDAARDDQEILNAYDFLLSNAGMGDDVDLNTLKGAATANRSPAVAPAPGVPVAEGAFNSFNTGLSFAPSSYNEATRRAGINPAHPSDPERTVGVLGAPGARRAYNAIGRQAGRRGRRDPGTAYTDRQDASAMWNQDVATAAGGSRAFVARLKAAQKYAKNSPLLRAMMMLYIGQPIYGASLKNMAAWGVPVPMNFIVVAPFVQFSMQAAYFCSPNIGRSEYDFEDTYIHTRADIKLVSAESMWFATCYVIDSSDLYISPGVKFAGYHPGTCTKEWMTSFRFGSGRRNNQFDFDISRFDDRRGALLCLHMGGSQGECDIGLSDSSVFDLAGKFESNSARAMPTNSRAMRELGNVTYPSALFVNRETGIYKLNETRPYKDETMLDIQKSTAVRTTVMRGAQYAWNEHTQTPVMINEGCGVFSGISSGCRNLLEGGCGLIGGGVAQVTAH